MDSLLKPLLAGLPPDASLLAAILRRAAQPDMREELFGLARQKAQEAYGKRVFARGLIEFTNHCRCDCLYCGIRRSNRKAARYRLTPEEVLRRCEAGRALGFRTFVLQGGEDPWYTQDRMVSLIAAIKAAWPDCALTLSIGQKSRATYARFRQAGADRYLLRHETANAGHFSLLHPAAQTFAARRRCLRDLKALGFQTGAGFMVGSPGQTTAALADDLRFLWELQPQMVGIGPFLPHRDTPFGDQPPGGVEQTLVLLALTRLLLPRALLPATTALGTATLDSGGDGRERGILAGANVLMPNLSPPGARANYTLYNGKLSSGAEAAENLADLKRRVAAVGYEISLERGDYA